MAHKFILFLLLSLCGFLTSAEAESSSANSFYYRNKSTTADTLAASYKLTRNAASKRVLATELGMTDDTDQVHGYLNSTDPHYAAVLRLLAPASPGAMHSTEPRAFKVGLVALNNQSQENIAWIYYEPDYSSVKELPEMIAIGLVMLHELHDSRNTQIELITQPVLNIMLHIDEKFDVFDATTFELGLLGQAFQLNTIQYGCGAGGSICFNRNLRLLTEQNNRLTVVFQSSIAYYANIAGDWNRNGTRQHSINEVNGTLAVSQESVGGIPDLELSVKNAGNLAVQHFKPVKDASNVYQYISSDPTIIENVND